MENARPPQTCFCWGGSEDNHIEVERGRVWRGREIPEDSFNDYSG